MGSELLVAVFRENSQLSSSLAPILEILFVPNETWKESGELRVAKL